MSNQVKNKDREEEDNDLLERYSKFLEEHGYIDADWWKERPYAIEKFTALESIKKT